MTITVVHQKVGREFHNVRNIETRGDYVYFESVHAVFDKVTVAEIQAAGGMMRAQDAAIMPYQEFRVVR